MKKFLFLLLLPITLFAAPLTMKEKFQGAKVGDFVVTKIGNGYSLLIVRTLNDKTLELEEISVPENMVNPKQTVWRTWVSNNAPGHTSWTMISIDLKKDQIKECFSFSRRSWLQLSEEEYFLAKLMVLPLKRTPTSERKKIGPAPSGDVDRRKVWNPPLYIDGRKIAGAKFDAWKTRWPKDGTQLSEIPIDLYFDKENLCPFPYWIEFKSPHYNLKIHAVDSGHGLISPHKEIPPRPPIFVGKTKRLKDTGLRFTLNWKDDGNALLLMAIDLTGQVRMITPIPFSIVSTKQTDVFYIDVKKEDLDKLLVSGHEYQWAVSLERGTSLYSESQDTYKKE